MTDESLLLSLGPGITLGGDHTIEALLGEGAMGQVFLARHQLGPRAVKVLRTDLTSTPAMLAPLRAEAQLVIGLRHEGIRAVYDFREDKSFGWFISMENVDGVSLRGVLDRQPGHRLPATAARHIATRLAEAMAHAHSRPTPVIHRDLKPDNVFLTGVSYDADAAALSRAGVKILDFGLGGIAGSEEAARVSGTLPYMAPEQLDGRPSSPASDVWSLGVMLYEMLAGTLPFKGSDAAAQIRAASWPSLPADVPAPLTSVVAACLKRSPEDRPRHAGALVQLLQAATEAPSRPTPERTTRPPAPPAPSPVRPQPPAPSPSRLPFAIGSAIVLGIITLLGWRMMTAQPSSPTTPAATAAASAIHVGLRTEDGRTQYPIGDTATILVESDTAGYLTLLAFSADDAVGTLWPRPGELASPVAAGQVIRLSIPATEPPGRDVLVAVVGKAPVTLPASGRLSHLDAVKSIGIPSLSDEIQALRTGAAGPGSRLVASPGGYALLLLETVRPVPGS